MLSLLKTAALCSLAAVAAAQPTGLLYGLFTDGDGICQLMSISPTTGENVTIGPVDICNQVSQRFPAQSTWNSVTKELVVAIQAGPSVFSVDINTAKTTVLAPLPEYNSTDRLLGIRELAGKIYMVTQYHVYVVANGKLNDLNVPLAAPEYAQVAGVASGGTKNAPILYVAEEDTKKVYVIDTGDVSSVSTFNSGVNGCIDLQYSISLGMLVQLQSYQLYQTNPVTGKSSRIGPVPDGPGYPRVNGLSPDGTTIFIIDFANVFTIDLSSGDVSTPYPFTWAPRQVGFPQWVDTSA